MNNNNYQKRRRITCKYCNGNGYIYRNNVFEEKEESLQKKYGNSAEEKENPHSIQPFISYKDILNINLNKGFGFIYNNFICKSIGCYNNYDTDTDDENYSSLDEKKQSIKIKKSVKWIDEEDSINNNNINNNNNNNNNNKK